MVQLFELRAEHERLLYDRLGARYVDRCATLRVKLDHSAHDAAAAAAVVAVGIAARGNGLDRQSKVVSCLQYLKGTTRAPAHACRVHVYMYIAWPQSPCVSAAGHGAATRRRRGQRRAAAAARLVVTNSIAAASATRVACSLVYIELQPLLLRVASRPQAEPVAAARSHETPPRLYCNYSLTHSLAPSLYLQRACPQPRLAARPVARMQRVRQSAKVLRAQQLSVKGSDVTLPVDSEAQHGRSASRGEIRTLRALQDGLPRGPSLGGAPGRVGAPWTLGGTGRADAALRSPRAGASLNRGDAREGSEVGYARVQAGYTRLQAGAREGSEARLVR